MTDQQLASTLQTNAKSYLTETGDTIDTFPASIASYVVEWAVRESHFPNYFDEARIVEELSTLVYTLTMACIEVYARAGAEGEKGHSENAISRTYDGAWISPRLHDALPNYVGVL